MSAEGEREARTREAKLRRAARRQGLDLVKSGRRDPRGLDHQGYWLVDVYTNRVEVGGDHGTDLDAIERAVLAGVAHTKPASRRKGTSR